MGEVYLNVHKHIENLSDNEDARRYLIVYWYYSPSSKKVNVSKQKEKWPTNKALATHVRGRLDIVNHRTKAFRHHVKIHEVFLHIHQFIL